MTALDPAPLAAPTVAADTADDDHHLLDLVVDLATLDSHDETTRRLPDLLERLADETGARACQIDTATTASRGARDAQWQTVASVGYSSTVAHHLGGAFLSSPHGQLVLASNAPLRIENNVHDFCASSHFRDVLQPAGYDDGVSLALRAVTGESRRHPPPLGEGRDDLHHDSIAQLPAVGRVLARVTEVASCSARDVTLPPDYAVVHIDAAGRARPVVGRDPLHLELDEDVLTILRTILAAGVRFASFLHLQDGRLVEVRVHSPEGRHTARQPCIVATRPASSTLGLTLAPARGPHRGGHRRREPRHRRRALPDPAHGGRARRGDPRAARHSLTRRGRSQGDRRGRAAAVGRPGLRPLARADPGAPPA